MDASNNPEHAMEGLRHINNSNLSMDISLNSTFDEYEELLINLGPRYRSFSETVVLTVFYCAIFLTGVVGNVSTCIVIIKNGYMHTATNYYLFSLAVSDLLTLILGLPPELHGIWQAYPWIFGEPYCQFKAFITEMTSTASVLTITSFTVERYIAICHPIRAQTMSNLSRAIKIIFLIWLLAALMVLPVPIHIRTFHAVTDPYEIADSLVCNVPRVWRKHKMNIYFAFSTIFLFILPMSVITALYIRIGVTLRHSGLARQCSNGSGNSPQYQSRRAVLNMLVAVVVAFFICWAPFHAQRLMTVIIKDNQWTVTLLEIQSQLFYVSGILWFVSSTVNPILYNLMSRKYREAFKLTLCRCCFQSVSAGRRSHPSVRRFPSQPSETYVSGMGTTRVVPDKHQFYKSTSGGSNRGQRSSSSSDRACGHWTKRLGLFTTRSNGNVVNKARVGNGNIGGETSRSCSSSPVVTGLPIRARDELREELELAVLNAESKILPKCQVKCEPKAQGEASSRTNNVGRAGEHRARTCYHSLEETGTLL